MSDAARRAAPPGGQTLRVGVTGPLLVVHDKEGFLAGTLIRERSGPAYLRLVGTTIRIRRFSVGVHAVAGWEPGPP